MTYVKRLMWAEYLKIISIFGVIIIHSSAPYLLKYKNETIGWWTGNLYDTLFRWCIPVFFMLSGTFILEQVQSVSIRQFYLRRFKRIVMPFFIWSVVYFIWRVLVNKEEIAIVNFFWLFLKEPVYYHLWFIYTLIGLYLLAPFLGIYLKYASKGDIAILIIFWFIFGSLIPTFEALFNIKTYLSIETPSYIFNYTGYFLLGYAFRNLRPKWGWIIFLCVLFIFVYFCTAYGTYFLTVKVEDGKLIDTLYAYYSVNVLMMSLSIFIVVKSIRFPVSVSKNKLFVKTFQSLGVCIPGIYLVHAMVISLLKGNMQPVRIIDDRIAPWIGIPVFSLAVLIVSFFLIYVIRRVPYLKYLVP